MWMSLYKVCEVVTNLESWW